MPTQQRPGRRVPSRITPERARTEMTPMIDVTFLLLVFFMLTVQFKTLEGLLAAHLPPDAGRSAERLEPRDDVDLRIEVLRAGTPQALDGSGPWSGTGPFRFGPDREVRWSVGPWSTRDRAALAARLGTVRRHEPDRRVVVDARAGTVWSEVVTAVDAARQAGWEEVAFAAQR